MKKNIALLLGVLVLATAIFAACSPTPTTRTVRWKENESYVFNITLADFNLTDSSGTLFRSYENEGKTYYRDAEINAQEGIIMRESDQLRPVDARGTYTMKLTAPTSDTWKLETEQVLYSQYKTETLQELKCLETLKDYVVSPASDENPFSNTVGMTTLRSETVTSVVFANNASQLPQISSMENKGFYIGKINQSVSNYKYEATYDFNNRVVSVKKDGGEAVEHKLGLKKNGTCIDSNQMLLYMRSLDKSSAAFADNPSVAVYNVASDYLTTAAFGITRNFNAALNVNGSNRFTVVNSIGAAVGGTPFITQFNLPDISSVDDVGYDFLPEQGVGKLCKYTTIKFRSGWYSYEIAEYNADELAALDKLASSNK